MRVLGLLPLYWCLRCLRRSGGVSETTTSAFQTKEDLYGIYEDCWYCEYDTTHRMSPVEDRIRHPVMNKVKFDT